MFFGVRHDEDIPWRTERCLARTMEASGMAACGTKHHFAAAERNSRCRWNSGRSADVAPTVAPDLKADIVLRQSAADFFLRFVSFIASMNCRLRRLAKELRCQ
jgi:hypothetical protein